MVRGKVRQEWKAAYFVKVERLLTEYKRVFICDADNVTSKQFQNIRVGMRGRGEVLMGKNTMMKRAIRDMIQALAIPTKISRGNIEITAPVKLLEVGDRVSESAATLLNMLKISPFTYGLDILNVFDNGSVFNPAILDIDEEDIRNRFMSGVQNVAAVSLAIGYPTVASVPHSIANAFRNIMAVAAATDIEFEQVAQMKAFLADPSAFAAVEQTIAAAEEEQVAAAPEESEEESDDDMGFGLFD